MFGYYVNQAFLSFRRSSALTALTVLAISLGIGACMTTITLFHALSGDPIPQRSSQLFYVQLDAATLKDFVPGEEPNSQVTRLDAEALLRESRASHQTISAGGAAAVQASDGSARISPFVADLRFNSADFFPMFQVPFRYGQPWQAVDDEARARVAVLSSELNNTLFGGNDSTGRTLRVAGRDFRIVGVLAPWRPIPRYYDLIGRGAFATPDLAYIPYSTSRDLKLTRSGLIDCWGDAQNDPSSLGAPCAWIQYWAQLNTLGEVSAYRRYLEDYAQRQHTAGRFERPPNNRLRSVMAWLDYNQVVPKDVRLQMLMSFGFLIVCLVNAMGLLLAKCMRRSPEIGVRRALGASRQDIFTQLLFEAGTVGLAGGVLGLLFAFGGLWVVRQNPADYAQTAYLDAPMLFATCALAVISSLFAGLLPAWRASGITPAQQLKAS